MPTVADSVHAVIGGDTHGHDEQERVVVLRGKAGEILRLDQQIRTTARA